MTFDTCMAGSLCHPSFFSCKDNTMNNVRTNQPVNQTVQGDSLLKNIYSTTVQMQLHFSECCFVQQDSEEPGTLTTIILYYFLHSTTTAGRYRIIPHLELRRTKRVSRQSSTTLCSSPK